ncbi:MAG: PepSY domain-containing protein, partial [Pseudomonadota bacterium]
MRKSIFMLSAAVAIAGLSSSPAMAANAAKFRLPPPKAPKNQILSPGAVAKSLKQRGYAIEKMKRNGTTYSVTATSKSRNKVQMTVDGRSGDIVGLAVLQAAPNLLSVIAAIVKSGKGTRYIDDSHPFGIIIPDIYQTRWVSFTPSIWDVFTTEYVPAVWSGGGYRFAVPYNSIRPGYGGYSYSTFATTDLGSPIYDVYDYNGTEISTSYSEESYEMSQATTWESTYETQNESYEESYLDGTIDDAADVDVDDVADYDSEDGDFNVADDANDGYDADIDDDDGGDQADGQDD